MKFFGIINYNRTFIFLLRAPFYVNEPIDRVALNAENYLGYWVYKGVWMIQQIIRLKQLNSTSINQVLTLINTNVKQISSLEINDSSILFYKEIAFNV